MTGFTFETTDIQYVPSSSSSSTCTREMCFCGSSSASVQVASRPIVTGSASKSRVWKSVGLPPCLVKTLTVTGIALAHLGSGAVAHVASAPAALDPAAVHHGAVLLGRRQRLAKEQAAAEELRFLGEPRRGRLRKPRGEIEHFLRRRF